MENQWPKGYKAPVDLAKMGRNLKPFILQELRDQEGGSGSFFQTQRQTVGKRCGDRRLVAGAGPPATGDYRRVISGADGWVR